MQPIQCNFASSTNGACKYANHHNNFQKKVLPARKFRNVGEVSFTSWYRFDAGQRPVPVPIFDTCLSTFTFSHKYRALSLIHPISLNRHLLSSASPCPFICPTVQGGAAAYLYGHIYDRDRLTRYQILQIQRHRLWQSELCSSDDIAMHWLRTPRS